VQIADGVLVVLAVLLVVAVVVARVRAGRSGSSAGDLDTAMDPDERAQLEEALAAVHREHGEPVRRLIASRVVVLKSRGVPLRAVRGADEPPIARLLFANGTVLRARPRRAGEWAPLVVAVTARHHTVVIESFTVGEDDVGIVLSGPGGLRQSATVVGLDDPD
jgi:hypothetical protein